MSPNRGPAKIDSAVLLIAPPQHGKTTYVRNLCEQHLLLYPHGIALVHDVKMEFSELCSMYESVDEYRAAHERAVAEQKPIARGAAFSCMEWEPIAELAFELGTLHNRLGNIRLPIFLACDETSMIETSGSTHIGRRDLQIAAQRAHLGISSAMNLQRRSALMDAFYDMCTDVIIFGMHSDDDARVLEKRLGLPKRSLQPMVGAPPFVYAHWKQGRGLV